MSEVGEGQWKMKKADGKGGKGGEEEAREEEWDGKRGDCYLKN